MQWNNSKIKIEGGKKSLGGQVKNSISQIVCSIIDGNLMTTFSPWSGCDNLIFQLKYEVISMKTWKNKNLTPIKCLCKGKPEQRYFEITINFLEI